MVFQISFVYLHVLQAMGWVFQPFLPKGMGVSRFCQMSLAYLHVLQRVGWVSQPFCQKKWRDPVSFKCPLCTCMCFKQWIGYPNRFVTTNGGTPFLSNVSCL